MRVLLLLLVCCGVLTVTTAWEEWLFPMAMMRNMHRRRQVYHVFHPPGVYSQPVGPARGWRGSGGYQRAPVRDALWYDNHT